MSATSAPELELVQREVQGILSRSAAWRELPVDERLTMATNMAKVGSYLASDPGWLDSPTPPGHDAVATTLGPIENLQKRLAEKPGQVGQDFRAGAVREGVDQFKSLVKAVDFPEFVSGLINGVFQAIVTASIQQMEAYGELLAATAKTVEQFAQDHITDDQARNQIALRYPSIVKIERSSDGGNRLAPTSDDANTDALRTAMNTHETIDFNDGESERKFLASAKLEMARQRQKMMALMVLLGINRIVVTNGRINAKVVFDMRASDNARRRASAGLTDDSSSESAMAATAGGPWGGVAGYSATKHVATVRSSVDDDSESKAQVKANLTGEVRVNFKSETFPPERMLDAMQLEQFNYLATPGATPRPTTETAASSGASGAASASGPGAAQPATRR